jgi:hypothetical protein
MFVILGRKDFAHLRNCRVEDHHERGIFVMFKVGFHEEGQSDVANLGVQFRVVPQF